MYGVTICKLVLLSHIVVLFTGMNASDQLHGNERIDNQMEESNGRNEVFVVEQTEDPPPAQGKDSVGSTLTFVGFIIVFHIY